MLGLGRLQGAVLPWILKRVTEEVCTVSTSFTIVKPAEGVWCFLPAALPLTPDTRFSSMSQFKLQSKVKIKFRCKAGCRTERKTQEGAAPLGWWFDTHPFLNTSLFFTACDVNLQGNLSCLTQEPRFSRRSHQRIKKVEEQPSQLWYYGPKLLQLLGQPCCLLPAWDLWSCWYWVSNICSRFLRCSILWFWDAF